MHVSENRRHEEIKPEANQKTRERPNKLVNKREWKCPGSPGLDIDEIPARQGWVWEEGLKKNCVNCTK